MAVLRHSKTGYSAADRDKLSDMLKEPTTTPRSARSAISVQAITCVRVRAVPAGRLTGLNQTVGGGIPERRRRVTLLRARAAEAAASAADGGTRPLAERPQSDQRLQAESSCWGRTDQRDWRPQLLQTG